MRRYRDTAAALCAAAAAVVLLLTILSPDPAGTIGSLIRGPFANTYTFGNMLATMSILIICGAGMTISFQAGLFNLGGEGQIYSAGLAGAVIGLLLPVQTGIIGTLLIMIIGTAVGALIAGVSGYLLYRFRIHELISSFLLSGALVYFVDFLISNPLRDTDGFLQSTRQIPQAFRLPSILPPSNLTSALFFAVITAASLAFWLYRMRGGYELRVFGTNPSFAEFGAIPHKRYTILPMLITGACYGLAGTLMVLSTQYAAIMGFTAGYGWNGIAVALIAGNNPILVIPAAFLLAWLETGIRTAMSGSSLSFDMSNVIRGIILLSITLRLAGSRRRSMK
ncbi:MAG: ABC transporter permease [Spirochaetia bacterium]|nr:ABC transporter permease [Spirochaetia bacterium]MCF7941753.1 ABC transporter permease [Spirochaetia bacterium]